MTDPLTIGIICALVGVIYADIKWELRKLRRTSHRFHSKLTGVCYVLSSKGILTPLDADYEEREENGNGQ